MNLYDRIKEIENYLLEMREKYLELYEKYHSLKNEIIIIKKLLQEFSKGGEKNE